MISGEANNREEVVKITNGFASKSKWLSNNSQGWKKFSIHLKKPQLSERFLYYLNK